MGGLDGDSVFIGVDKHMGIWKYARVNGLLVYDPLFGFGSDRLVSDLTKLRGVKESPASPLF